MTTFIRRSIPLALALALAHAVHSHSLHAQSGSSIARRVAQAPDGEMRMTYASRPSACGDGRDVVAIGDNFMTNRSMQSYGRWSNMRCVPGPARVSLTVRGHEVVELRTFIGGSWPANVERVTDLGRVPAPEAANYFLALATTLGSSGRTNTLLAAAAADSANVSPEMLRLAKTTSLSRETRRHAVHWAGALGDASTVAPLVAMARASDDGRSNADDVGPGDGMEGAAVGALSMIPDGAGMPALMELARRASPTVRKAAVFWLGQGGDRTGRELVRTIAADDRESETLRGAAIFALGQGEESSASDDLFLRELFGKLTSERLKDRVLMGVSQHQSSDGARWLLAQARDDRQPIEVRRKAVFWAGQGQATVADLTALYGATTEPRLREHIIFVLSQRSEEPASSALLSIARSDADREMRRKALFWLAQKDDPRVTKLITDLVSH
jgi:HEAT repeat protein